MADLLKWFKDREKQAQGVYHQVNPFDGGRTYDTNQRGVAPGTPNPINVRSDNTPGFQWSNNSLTRGLSRAFDQINPVDNNRTWQQRAPVGPNRNVGQQLWNGGPTGTVIQSIVKPVQQSANTIGAGAAGVIGLGEAGYQSLFGTDKSYQDKLNETDAAIKDLLNHGWGNKGGFGSYDEISNADLFGTPEQRRDLLAPVARGVASDAPLVLPGLGGVGTKVGTRIATAGAINAGVGGGSTALQEVAEGQPLNPKEILTNSAVAGVIGGAFPAAGAVIRKGAPAVVDTVKAAAPSRIVENHPAVRELNDTLTTLNGQRGRMIKAGMSENAPAMKQNTRAYQMAVQERDRVMKSVAQGGYVKLPGSVKSLLSDERGSVQIPGRKGPGEATPELNPADLTPSSKLSPKGRKTPELQQADTRVPLKSVMKSSSSETPKPPTSLNVDKFNVSQKAKKALKEVQTEMADDIHKKTGTRLTNKEVRETAAATGKVLKNARTREATKQYLASRLRLQQDVAALLKKRSNGTLTDAEAVRLNQGILQQKAAATDAGRVLQAHREVADPHEVTVLDAMIGKIQEQTDNLDAVHAELGKLGANPTPKQLTEFYRKFVSATKEDWLDKYRYTNMLSSPLTHIVNTASNLSGVAGLAPIQKLAEGSVDAARAVITGGPRTRFASEAGSYYKGVGKSIPAAFKAFSDVMSNKKITGNPDMDSLRNIPLATEGAKGVADKVLSFVPKLLEAGDQFGTELAKGGEKAAFANRVNKGVTTLDIPERVLLNGKKVTKITNRKITPELINQLTNEKARYRLFRQELKKEGQGHLLDLVDIPAQTISQMRNSDSPYVRTIAKFTVPFISTPTNIFKQGIEYSPIGIATLHGSADKTAQAAKMLMGTSTVALAAGALAAGGDITFGEPTNSDQRNAFRAEGKQAYSFKLPGSNIWVNYSKLHPAIAMNLAIVGAVKDATDKGSISDSQAEKALNIGAGIVNYFTDQSYMKNVGDFVNVLQGKDNTNASTIASSQATNTTNQLVPFKSLTSWVGRIIDPTQRKVDSKTSAIEQTYQGIIKDIPGLNKNVPTRDNPYTGEPLKNPYPVLNSFNPNRISKDLGYGNTTGLNIDQREQLRDLPADQKEVFRRGIIEQKALDKQVAQEKADLKDGRAVITGGVQNNKNSQIKQLSSGEFYAKIGGEFKTFKTKEKAQDALAADNFVNSDKKIQTIGNKVYLKSDNQQGYTVKSKPQYDFDQADSKNTLAMERAKTNDDLDAWGKAANDQYEALMKLRKSYDPETEQDKINDIDKKIDTLKNQAAKYSDYGGFTKGRKKSARKGFQAPGGKAISAVGGGAADTRKLITSLEVKGTRLRRKF